MLGECRDDEIVAVVSLDALDRYRAQRSPSTPFWGTRDADFAPAGV